MAEVAFQHGQDPRDVFPLEGFSSNMPPTKRFFDRFGNTMVRKEWQMDEDWEARVEFIVLPTGDCVSTKHGEWSLVTFEDPKTQQNILTAARPNEIFRDDDGHWMVDYQWIRPDNDYATLPDKHNDVRDIIYTEHTVLALRSMQGSLRLCHLESVPMPYYRETFAILNKWCRGRTHREIGFWTACDKQTPEFVGVDVYDVLELFFTEPQLLGRTRIGEWLWQHALQPYLGLNCTLATKLLCAQTFNVEEEKCAQHTPCMWCGAHAAFEVNCEPFGKLFVDAACLNKTRRFFDVGVFLRNVRAHTKFSPQCVEETQTFFTTLHIH